MSSAAQPPAESVAGVTQIITVDQLDQAVDVLVSGGLVAFPTETVYGLGADAESSSAVSAVFEAKGRPAGHPLIVHLASASQLDRWAVDIDDRARRLAAEFWPGPLTIILRRSEVVALEAVGGRDTIGLRVPDHPATLELLKRFDGGLAGPSANRFGHVSPTEAQHVVDDLDGRVDLVLDGGPARVGLESTIVEVLDGPVTLLRPGGVSADAIEALLCEPVIDGRDGQSRAAGMLASHYAPSAPVVVVAGRSEVDLAGSDVVIAAEPDPHANTGEGQERTIVLGVDAASFAHGLYAALRQADAMGASRIVIVPPSTGQLLPAVLDRLIKASAPRP